MLSNSAGRKFDSALVAARCGGRALAHALGRALPQHCALCTAACGCELLCDGCQRALPELGEACPRCALPTPGRALCGSCLRDPPPFLMTLSALLYAFPVDRLVQGLKYGHQLALAQPLADRLAAAVALRTDKRSRPAAIVAMPLARRRQRQRGFNQASLLAKALSARLGIPLVNALAREGDAPPQAGLSRAARLRNVRNAFRAAAPVTGLHVAIVDDVMTTGTTVAAAARVLLGAGAARVDAWVVARALPRGR